MPRHATRIIVRSRVEAPTAPSRSRLCTALPSRDRDGAVPSILALLLLLLFSPHAAAVDLSLYKPQGYVSDFAGVIDAQSKLQLERFGGRVERATGVQMAFVTLDTLEDEPVTDAANTLYRQWGIGQKGKDEGLLLLLVIKDRRSRLEVGRGLEPIITDGTSGELLREMRPALRENRHGEALLAAAHSLADRISRAKGVSLDSLAPPPRARPQQEPQIPWFVLLGGVFLLFWIVSLSRRGGYYDGGGVLPGIIIGNMLNRSTYSGHSHGGFGGYDSGDSFGGFGGGDSGGGGASSDW